MTSWGHTLHKNILNASYFGIPQARERVYFVALRKDMKTSSKSALDYNPPKENRKNIFLEDILDTNVDADFFINRKDIRVLKKEYKVENKLESIIGSVLLRIYSPKGNRLVVCGGVGAKNGTLQNFARPF